QSGWRESSPYERGARWCRDGRAPTATVAQRSRGARGTCFGAQERAEAGAQGAVARRPRGTGMRAGRGGGGRMRVLVIDNYDSFTYNLVQLAGSLGADVVVRRNDEVTVEALRALRPDRVIASPGPGDPSAAGMSCEAIRAFSGDGVPTLGVCLGHHCIGAALGARIVRAPTLRHGKTSAVRHDG